MIGAKRILVADDEFSIADAVSEILTGEAHTVVLAFDGLRALDLLMREPFDLVILDVMMPVMDGVETLRRMRASATLHDVPVLMMSAANIPKLPDESRVLTMRKPFDVQKLLDSVERALIMS